MVDKKVKISDFQELVVVPDSHLIPTADINVTDHKTTLANFKKQIAGQVKVEKSVHADVSAESIHAHSSDNADHSTNSDKLNNKEDTKFVQWIDTDTDGELKNNSDKKIATQKATKTYVDTKLDTKANKTDVYTKAETDTELGKKANANVVQDKITAGNNITIEKDDKNGIKINSTGGGGGTDESARAEIKNIKGTTNYNDPTPITLINTKTSIDTINTNKADKSYVDTELGKKATTVLKVTMFSDINTDRPIGEAKDTVDIYDIAIIQQITGGRTFTIPDPTDAGNNKRFIIENNRGSGQAFSIKLTLPNPNSMNIITMNVGVYQEFFWDGKYWTPANFLNTAQNYTGNDNYDNWTACSLVLARNLDKKIDTKANQSTTYTKTEVDTSINKKEDSLGNPTKDGQILSSTVAGKRTWIDGGGGGNDTEARNQIKLAQGTTNWNDPVPISLADTKTQLGQKASFDVVQTKITAGQNVVITKVGNDSISIGVNTGNGDRYLFGWIDRIKPDKEQFFKIVPRFMRGITYNEQTRLLTLPNYSMWIMRASIVPSAITSADDYMIFRFYNSGGSPMGYTGRQFLSSRSEKEHILAVPTCVAHTQLNAVAMDVGVKCLDITAGCGAPDSDYSYIEIFEMTTTYAYQVYTNENGMIYTNQEGNVYIPSDSKPKGRKNIKNIISNERKCLI